MLAQQADWTGWELHFVDLEEHKRYCPPNAWDFFGTNVCGLVG